MAWLPRLELPSPLSVGALCPAERSSEKKKKKALPLFLYTPRLIAHSVTLRITPAVTAARC